jgi:hypothetical protein
VLNYFLAKKLYFSAIFLGSLNLYHVCPHHWELIEALYCFSEEKKSSFAGAMGNDAETGVCVSGLCERALAGERKTISGNSHLAELRFCCVSGCGVCTEAERGR